MLTGTDDDGVAEDGAAAARSTAGGDEGSAEVTGVAVTAGCSWALGCGCPT